MKILNIAERFVFESRAWKFIAVILVVSLMKTGIWAIPNIVASQMLAQDPFRNPFSDPGAQYLFWNWLGPFIAWLLHATSTTRFFVLHLAFSCAFTLLFIWTSFSRLDSRSARIAVLIFAALPVSMTAYYWVSYDSLTLLLMMCALAMPSGRIMTAAVGIGLGMQHFEQSFVGSMVVLGAMVVGTVYRAEKEYSWKWLFCLIAGIIVGKLVLTGIVRHWGIEVNSGRVFWLKKNLLMTLHQFLYHPFVTVFSALGTAWLVAFKQIDAGRKSIPIFLGLAALLLLLPISGDQTRVFAVSSFFLLSIYWLLNPHFLCLIDNRTAAALFLAWLVVPWAWVWGAVPRASAFPMDFVYVLHHAFGWFTLQPDMLSWPFY
ncbi:hypothetical protein [Burkholderia multivorans]|jgi:hypothetical protein|uniref:hypothetical protein n=1 Tax=Burkholderia multivorans TaxID=87883 RepID=UPI001591BC80|nr:hypothetical protein [Burkholderia multivorans]MCA8336437.1 hypothetical protein [Burkholderia multivorans]